jgi:hypothetical protein
MVKPKEVGFSIIDYLDNLNTMNSSSLKSVIGDSRLKIQK